MEWDCEQYDDGTIWHLDVVGGKIIGRFTDQGIPYFECYFWNGEHTERLLENEYTLDELWDEFDGLEDNIIRPLITIIRTQQLEIRKLKNNDREKLLDRIKEDQIKMQELKDKLAIIKSTINC